MRVYLIAILWIFSICTQAEVAIKAIQFDPDKDFSTNGVDLFSDLEESTLQKTQKNHDLKVKRAKAFKKKIVETIKEEDFKQTYDKFLNQVFKTMLANEAKLVPGVVFFFNGFRNEGVVELDCDSSIIMLYMILYDVQQKFVHHDIISRYYFEAFFGHVCGVIKANDNTFLYEDINTSREYRFRTYERYVSNYKAHFWHTKKPLPQQGEAFKFFQFMDAGMHNILIANYEEAIRLMLIARRYSPDNVVIECNLGISYYGAKQYTKAAEHIKAANKICVLFAHAYNIWLDCMQRTDNYDSIDEIKTVVEKYRPEISRYHKAVAEVLFKNLLIAHLSFDAEQSKALFTEMIEAYETCLGVYSDPNYITAMPLKAAIKRVGIEDHLQVVNAFKRYEKAIEKATAEAEKAEVATQLITDKEARKRLDEYRSVTVLDVPLLKKTIAELKTYTNAWGDVDTTKLANAHNKLNTCFGDFAQLAELSDKFSVYMKEHDSQTLEKYMIQGYYADQKQQRMNSAAYFRLKKTLEALIEEADKK